MIRMLSLKNLIKFHEKIISKTGGTSGIRELGLIESALNRPFTSYGGTDLFTTHIEKIAAIVHSLICNHGFVDGNKRIGVAVMIILLEMNGIVIRYTQNELIDLGLKAANGKMNEKDIANWIIEHTLN